MESMLTSRSMRLAIDKGCITAYFAVHCVSEFCFGAQDAQALPERELKRKRVARQALEFLEEYTLLLLFRYCVEDGVPKVKGEPSAKKIQTCRSLFGPEYKGLERLVPQL